MRTKRIVILTLAVLLGLAVLAVATPLAMGVAGGAVAGY